MSDSEPTPPSPQPPDKSAEPGTLRKRLLQLWPIVPAAGLLSGGSVASSIGGALVEGGIADLAAINHAPPIVSRQAAEQALKGEETVAKLRGEIPVQISERDIAQRQKQLSQAALDSERTNAVNRVRKGDYLKVGGRIGSLAGLGYWGYLFFGPGRRKRGSNTGADSKESNSSQTKNFVASFMDWVQENQTTAAVGSSVLVGRSLLSGGEVIEDQGRAAALEFANTPASLTARAAQRETELGFQIKKAGIVVAYAGPLSALALFFNKPRGRRKDRGDDEGPQR